MQEKIYMTPVDTARSNMGLISMSRTRLEVEPKGVTLNRSLTSARLRDCRGNSKVKFYISPEAVNNRHQDKKLRWYRLFFLYLIPARF